MQDFLSPGKATAVRADDQDLISQQLAAPGRTTLSQHYADSPHAVAEEASQAQPDVSSAEEVEPPTEAASQATAVPRIALASTIGAPVASAATQAPATPDASAVDVSPGPQIYSDSHTDAYGSHYQTDTAPTNKHWAKQDRFNKAAVKSNAMHDEHQVGRPGVRVHGKDLFTIKHAHATRYTFVDKDGKKVATPFDVVDKDTLTTINFNYKHHEQPKGKTRLLLNPAKAIHLDIHGTQTLCVLSWYGGLGAAWIPATALDGDTASIHTAVDAGAAKWRPDDTHAATTQYIVRNDQVGLENAKHDKPHGKGNVLAPHAKAGINVTDYLTHSFKRQKFDANGKVEKLQSGHDAKETKYTLNICQSLPQADAPPVAIDVANAGEAFFVVNDHSFHRTCSIYANGGARSTHAMKWVFGFVGKQEHGHWVPDHSRRGWVPLRTLALATDLKKKPA